MYLKRNVLFFMSLLFLSTTAVKPIQNNEISRLATIAIGVIISAGGTHLMVKNPKKREGLVCRIFRTACGAGMILAGLGLTLENERVIKQVSNPEIGYTGFLHNVATHVHLGWLTSYVFGMNSMSTASIG